VLAVNNALLLVDLQNDYFPGGTLELVGSLEAVAQGRKLLKAFRSKDLPVIHIQHIANRPGATFFLPGTPGAEIHPWVAPESGESVFQKHFPNSFRETGLLEHLKEQRISRLTVAGMMTHMCIDTTTRAAFDLGFECLLAHDACATRALVFGGVSVAAEHVHAAYMASLNGLFARVLSTDELCAAL